MIDLYYWPTPNGWKVTIMLEECGLDYTLKLVDIGGGDQFKPEFLRICPNNRMPAIIDHAPLGGGGRSRCSSPAPSSNTSATRWALPAGTGMPATACCNVLRQMANLAR